ncbi:MAG: hypothetical protein ACE5HF_00615 [Gemmatimonadota bacterium]
MSPFERWTVRITSGLTALSGLGYLWTKYLLSSPDPWAVVNHPLEPWFLKIHVLTAPLLVFAIGLIAVRHVWEHVRNGVRSGRRTGLLLVGSLGPMVASGYLVQIVTGDLILRLLALLHIASGLLFAVAVVAHVGAIARAARRQAPGRAAISVAPFSDSGVEARAKRGGVR